MVFQLLPVCIPVAIVRLWARIAQQAHGQQDPLWDLGQSSFSICTTQASL